MLLQLRFLRLLFQCRLGSHLILHRQMLLLILLLVIFLLSIQFTDIRGEITTAVGLRDREMLI